MQNYDNLYRPHEEKLENKLPREYPVDAVERIMLGNSQLEVGMYLNKPFIAVGNHPIFFRYDAGRYVMNIGRSKDNDVVIPDPSISRNHLVLVYDPQSRKISIQDISQFGSTVITKEKKGSSVKQGEFTCLDFATAPNQAGERVTNADYLDAYDYNFINYQRRGSYFNNRDLRIREDREGKLYTPPIRNYQDWIHLVTSLPDLQVPVGGSISLKGIYAISMLKGQPGEMHASLDTLQPAPVELLDNTGKVQYLPTLRSQRNFGVPPAIIKHGMLNGERQAFFAGDFRLRVTLSTQGYFIQVENINEQSGGYTPRATPEKKQIVKEKLISTGLRLSEKVQNW